MNVPLFPSEMRNDASEDRAVQQRFARRAHVLLWRSANEITATSQKS